MKIALLFRSYGPYHLARLRAARERHDILAIEDTDVDADYDWDAHAEKRAASVIALSGAAAAPRRDSKVSTSLARALKRFQADAVAIAGYSDGFALSALRVSRALAIPAILMSDTHAGTARNDIMRNFVKRRILPLYRSALVAGSVHADYLANLGFPRKRIAVGYDVVDNGHFAKPSLPADMGEIPGRQHFFCCSRLVAKKNLCGLIDAFGRYRTAFPATGWDLIIAGDGPLHEELERQRLARPCAAHVHLVGRKSYQELPALYRAASAFILPSSSDEWGLVVNEAMAAGLPLIVSRAAGCSSDLVQSGVNGFVFDPGDVDDLAVLMERIACAENRAEMGRASRRIIADWDVARFAAGLDEAAAMATQDYSPRRDLFGSTFAAALTHLSEWTH